MDELRRLLTELHFTRADMMGEVWTRGDDSVLIGANEVVIKINKIPVWYRHSPKGLALAVQDLKEHHD